MNLWVGFLNKRRLIIVTSILFFFFRVGFDHTYWNFGGSGSEYNYVESAIAAGRSVLIYDALGQFQMVLKKTLFHPKLLEIGVGLSSTPDGISVVQKPVDVEVAAALVYGLKTSWDGHQFGKIVAVGHGYGRYEGLFPLL